MMSSKLRIVIVGAGGRLGAALVRAYGAEFDVRGFNRAQLDLAQAAAIHETLAGLDFDVMINAAAQTNVDRCETERDEAFQLNADAPRLLAEIASAKGAKLVHISTDYVFDGEQREPYVETDAPNPISVYGASKRAGETSVLDVDGRHLVARVAWVFGPERPSFVDWLIGQARERADVAAVADKWSTPSYTLDLAAMLRPLLAASTASGLLHLTNGGGCSWREYAQCALDACRAAGIPLKTYEVGATSLAAMKNFIARRPVHTVLSTSKYERLTGTTPRDWREAVSEYVERHVSR